MSVRMLTATGLIVAVVLTVAVLPLEYICGSVVIIAQNTTANFTCSASGRRTPDWFVNETVATTMGDRYRVSTSSINRDKLTATLTIDGNRTCETVNVYCEVYNTTEERFLIMHNTTLRFQGRLPSPENFHIKEHINSSTIQWKPPYSSLNNDIIHVDPHITQYTVYITDNYTGSSIVEKNVTETQFTSTIEVKDSCPMYRVSAWNAGGEGELSEPVQWSTSQVPRRIAAESITGAVEANTLRISINNVDGVCTSRIPEFFLITLMTSVGRVFNETRQHQPGQPVADFTISLPQSVDVCSLHMRISAGNSAGISSPSEAIEVVCSSARTDTTTSASSAAITNTGSGGNTQQEDSTTIIVIISVVIGVTVGVVIVTAAVGIMCCLKHKRKSKVDSSDDTEKYKSKSPSFSGQVSPSNEYSQSPTHRSEVPEAVYDIPERNTGRESSDSAETADRTTNHAGLSEQVIPYAESGHPPPTSATMGSPSLVYVQVDPKKNRVSPPSKDDTVQYAQIKHQDKL